MFKEFIKELEEKKIEIFFSNGKLQYSGPEKNIDEELISKLKKYKAKLHKYYWPSDCPNMMPINTEGNKIPLILLHAGAANYSLSEHFGKDQPFYGFFYIGSSGEKIKHNNLESFAKDYLDQLLKIIPSGPYILGGFSLGGVLAFDMAIQLQKMGSDVRAVILVDSVIAYLVDPIKTKHGIIKTLIQIYNFTKKIFYWFYYNGRRIFYEFFNILKIKLPKNFRKPYILWTYTNLLMSYKPKVAFKGEILLFRMDANPSYEKYLGWDKLCESIEVVTIKGDHSNMYESIESISVLREKISQLLYKINSNVLIL